ncbi:MAG: response regulator [Oryzomonas sp.]|uniref:response regulator n=1 Tax=Oryzomonas sp. TaxID=2855186 RepID=UPI00284630B1|nr:response regulator [Oryzomonas sp.]MDR3579689.1 response regulator [Oryzomonas sp.]
MGIKILLADDSITIQKVVGIIFGADEYALTIVDNGKDAFDRALEIVPDVLLIDAVMPGMSGYELCEAIRTTPTLATKPILLLTGSFEPFDENKAKNCGADDFLAKPFESQQIVAKVKALFELGLSRTSTATLIQPAGNASAFQASPEPEPLKPPATPSATAAAIDSAEPADIWGAFIPATGPAATAVAEGTFPEQGDAFAAFDEELGPEAVQHRQTVGSQWIPVEEQTFEFAPEPFAEAPAAAFAGPSLSAGETAFGTISPTETAHRAEPVQAPPHVTPVSEPFIASPPLPVVEAGVPADALSEEQLRAAITSASREVIERIVWEIVPDLAEAMIRDAILKIQEGR